MTVTTNEYKKYIHTADEIRELMMEYVPRNKHVLWARALAKTGEASKSLMLSTARHVYVTAPVSAHDVGHFRVTKKAVKESAAWKKDFFDIEYFSFLDVITSYAYVDEADGLVKEFDIISVDLYIN